MSAENYENRRNAVSNALKRGDHRHIADIAGVKRQWVYMVVKGQGVSDRILTIAEQVIANRANEN